MTADPPTAQLTDRVGSRLSRLPTGGGLVVSYVLLIVFVAALDPRFFHWGNVETMLTQSAGLGVTTVGMAFVIIGGGYDLSVGSIAGFSGVLFAKFAQSGPLALAALGALGIALACGVVNGIIVARLRVNSFMATFASGLAFLGIALYYQGPQQITVTTPGFGALGLAKWGPVPEPIVLMVGVFVVGGVVLQATRFGQNVYAVGGSREAARLVGIPVRFTSGMTFVVSGLLAGLAGLLIASQLGLGSYDSSQTLPIEAIAAVVVGGISVYGGEGRMWRAALGMLILATLNNVFIALAWSTQAQAVAEGIVILFALGANLLSRQASSRRAEDRAEDRADAGPEAPAAHDRAPTGTAGPG